MIQVAMNAEQLRNALAEIEIAESHGIMHCDAVFELVEAGRCLGDNRVEFYKLIVKGHPTDPRQNWGCYDNHRDHRYVDGDLVSLTMEQ